MVGTTATKVAFALRSARKELLKSLAEGIDQFQRNLGYSNAPDVRRGIERFTDALGTAPGAVIELRERATLIQRLCGPGSVYESSRTTALRGCKRRRGKVTAPKLALDDLHKWSESPLWLTDVVRFRQNIERVLAANLNLAPEVRDAFVSWGSACVAVESEANPLAVDGCYYMLNIAAARDPRAAPNAHLAAGILQCNNLGGVHLPKLKVAVEVMMEWVRRPTTPSQPSLSKANSKKTKRTGLPAPDPKIILQEASLTTEWKRAKDSGVYKPDFAQGHGLSTSDFQCLLNRVAKRKSRSDK